MRVREGRYVRPGVVYIGWGSAVRGREGRGLEVFNESMGLYGRMQQEGRIERFNVVLLDPNGDLAGYIELHGSAEQLSSARHSEDFRRTLTDASLIVERLRLIDGYTNGAIAKELELYQESITKVPQTA